jgi:hypothetical protein
VRIALAACVTLALVSFGVAAPAPSYDPTAWLHWGREIAHWRLSTVDGPAFKPLPVGIATLLAPLGTAAPALWVLVARAAALAALPLAFAVGRRVANGSLIGGLLAAAGVALCEGAIALGASGMTEGAVIALGLGALEAAHRRRRGTVLACVTAAALLRVEAWPALLLVLALAWRDASADRRLLAAIALAVPAAWFGPELAGSGDLLRSGARARVSEPGQPARDAVALWSSLRAAVGVLPWPLWLGAALVGVTARAALVPAAIGVAWIALVALMAQAGFSGEPRYALPGAALVAVSGAAGITGAARRLPRAARVPALTATAAVTVLAALPALRDAGRVPARQAHAHALQADLRAVVAAVGRGRILACGRPYVGRLRGPMLAYALDVHRSRIEPDRAPAAPGTAFRSALRDGGPVRPQAPPGWPVAARRGAWELRARCDGTALRLRVP